MSKLTLSNIDLLLRGASTLACGGGLPYQDQKKQLNSSPLLQSLQKGVVLLEPSKLNKDQFFATVSEIGSADAPVMEKTQLSKALSLLEEKIGRKISGLIPGEIGQETITLESAALLQLPIVNSDLSGCRAVPRLSDLSLVVQGVPFTMSPLVVITGDGNLQFIPKNETLPEDEATVRKLVPKGEVVTMLGGVITGEMIQRFLPYRSYSLAMTVGTTLDSPILDTAAFPTEILLGPLTCEITIVDEQESQGFSEKKVTFVSQLGEGTLTIENEYMALEVGRKKFAFPQLIMLVDLQKKRGLHSSEIQKGMKITLIIGDAFSFWKGK